MKSSKNARIYSIIAAICFLISGASSLIGTIRYVNLIDDYSITFHYVLYLAIMFAFCVFLFIGKKNVGLVVVAGVAAALPLYFLISYLSIFTLISFLSSAALFGVILLAAMPSLRTNAKIVKYIWYIPAALLLVCNLLSSIRYSGTTFSAMLFSLLEAVAYLFFGMWLKEDVGSNVNYEDASTKTNKLFLEIVALLVLILGFVIALLAFKDNYDYIEYASIFGGAGYGHEILTEAGDFAIRAGMLMVYFLTLCIPIIYIILVLSKKKIEPTRNLAMVIIFAFLFEWIYYPIWIYQTSSTIKTSSKLKPFTHAFLCMIIPFYSIYWVNIHSKALYQKFIVGGKYTTDFSTLHTIVYFFVPFVGVALLQSKINEFYNPTVSIPYPYASPNVTQPQQTNCEQNFNEESIAEKLKHLKELMDQGVINSEDFEAKKKELLAKM